MPTWLYQFTLQFTELEGHKRELNYGRGRPGPCTKPTYTMVLARGHGVLTKQAYLSAISLLQSAKFPCILLELGILIGLQCSKLDYCGLHCGSKQVSY